MPPPLPVVYSSRGIEWEKDDKEATYLSPKSQYEIFQGHSLRLFLPSTNNALMEHVCTHCGLYFGSIKSKQDHSPNSRLKKSAKSSNKQSTQPVRKVQPQRIEARWQKELLCALVFQELEWHNIDEVGFDCIENKIPEITHGPGTPAVGNIEPVWTI